MRSDGWVQRAAEELRRLEEAADQALGELGAEAAAGRLEVGWDPAPGRDVTVYACGCGFSSESLEAMANHAIRGHRWPDAFPGLLEDHGQADGHF